MRFRTKVLGTLALAASLAAIAAAANAQQGETMSTTTAAEAVASVPLIPREALYGNPTRASGMVSPDGKWLSWMAPHEGVMNVWVAPASDPSAARRMTNATDRPIPQYFWAPDAQSLLYVQDKDGDENYLLYQVDVATGEERVLTPFEKTRVSLVGTSNTIKDKILVGLNNRDPRFHDVHLLDLKTGELKLVRENTEGFIGFLADDSLTLRWALAQNAAGGMDMYEIIDGKVAETPRESTGLEDSLTTTVAGYTTDGKTLYWIDSRGRNTAALIAEDTETGEKRVIAESDKADIGGTMSDPVTGEVEAYAVYYLRNEWTALDPDVKASLEWLDARLEGDFGVQSRTEDDTKWVVWNDPLTAPSKVYLYDRTAQTLTEFYTTRPELIGAPLQPMHPLEIRARDGLTLPSYLTLPPGSDPDGDGVPEAAVPMVLLVHGGPWARDGYGFNRAHQWLANRGYAVLSVNFRGSTGFGKEFVNAANLEWGAKMHDDLIDAVDDRHRVRYPDGPRAIATGEERGEMRSIAFDVQAFRVAVDTETGAVAILQSIHAADAGTVMNPEQCRGQVEGGVAQGIGAALYEEIMLDNGSPVTKVFRTYRVPQMADIPFTEVYFAETADQLGPFGAKSMSESPFNPVAPALANAIRRALDVRPYETPMSRDRIWRLTHQKSGGAAD